jgi:hypothetical protein
MGFGGCYAPFRSLPQYLGLLSLAQSRHAKNNLSCLVENSNRRFLMGSKKQIGAKLVTAPGRSKAEKASRLDELKPRRSISKKETAFN